MPAVRAFLVRDFETPSRVAQDNEEDFMAKATKRTNRGRNQDRARVAGRQGYEVRFTAKRANRRPRWSRR